MEHFAFCNTRYCFQSSLTATASSFSSKQRGCRLRVPYLTSGGEMWFLFHGLFLRFGENLYWQRLSLTGHPESNTRHVLNGVYTQNSCIHGVLYLSLAPLPLCVCVCKKLTILDLNLQAFNLNDHVASSSQEACMKYLGLLLVTVRVQLAKLVLSSREEVSLPERWLEAHVPRSIIEPGCGFLQEFIYRLMGKEI